MYKQPLSVAPSVKRAGSYPGHRLAQSGFGIVELIFVLAVLAIIAQVGFMKTMNEAQIEEARRAGNYLAQYNNAIRAYIAENAATISDGDTIGFPDLKAVGCGTGASGIEYLPCSFPETLFRGHAYATVVSRPGGAGTPMDAVTTVGPIQVDGSDAADMAGVIAGTAAAVNGNFANPAWSATFFDFSSDPATAVVTATASTGPSNDPWLRTDGSNDMEANLDFNPANPANQREITGASTITADGSVIAPRFEDATNPATWYLDPDGLSRVDEIDADDVYLRSRGIWLSDAVPDFGIYASSDLVTKPTCRAPALPRIYVSPVMMSEDAVGNPIGAIQAWAEDAGADWRVKLRILTKSGWFEPSATYGRVIAIHNCK